LPKFSLIVSDNIKVGNILGFYRCKHDIFRGEWRQTLLFRQKRISNNTLKIPSHELFSIACTMWNFRSFRLPKHSQQFLCLPHFWFAYPR